MKPPYRVPLLSEISALPWNGLKVASTFAGCGGSSLGYRMAGFKIIWASEFVEAARNSYQANCAPETIIDGRDIRIVEPNDILKATGLKVGELDVLDGSPPCASFSTAGRRARDWGKVKRYSDTEQRSDDLFFEFVRIRNGIMPKVFVAENVSGLVKGVAKGYFLEILKALKVGYRVEARLVDAQWLGVPQSRQRIIFVGVRDDLGVEPKFPNPLPYRYSIQEALPWIRAVGAIRETGFQAGSMIPGSKPSPTVMAGGGGGMNTSQFGVEAIIGIEEGVGLYKHRTRSLHRPSPPIMAGRPVRIVCGRTEPKVEEGIDISRFAIGNEWDKLREGEQSGKYFSLVKPRRNGPSPTITAEGGNPSIASVVHPTEKRKFSIVELKRVCAFPDDFILTGTYGQQWERLGRAVPPMMMFHLASAIRDGVLAKAGKPRRIRKAG